MIATSTFFRNGIRRTKDILSISLLSLLFYLLLFRYTFSYNFMPEVNTQYLIFLQVMMALFIFIIFNFFSIKIVSFHLIDALLVVLFLYSLLNILFDSTLLNLNNDYFIWCVIMVAVYFVIRMSSPFVVHYFLPFIIVIFFLFELYKGVQQLFLNFNIGDSLSLSINGSLKNSGIYSCYLIISLPIFTYLFKRIPVKRYFKILLFSIVLISVILILFFTKSRTAIITLAAFLILLFLYHSKDRSKRAFTFIIQHKILSSLVLFTLIVCCAYLLFQLKPASFIGRILVWKITLLHFPGYIFSGIGFGNFSFYYPYWQIEYFSHHLDSPPAYILNAAETHVAFNEFLQVLTETGIFGLIIFAGLIMYVLKLKVSGNKYFIFTLKVTIILILFSTLSSYVLHCNAVLFLFTFCIAALLSFSDIKHYNLKTKRAVPVACFALFQLLIGLTIIKSVQQNRFISKWVSLREDVFLPPAKIKSRYLNLYPHLKTNGKFLLDMGEHLSDIDDLNGAIKVLEESKHFYISERTFVALSNAYYQSGNIKMAIKTLKEQSNLIPSKFYPKYNLVKLYYQSGDTTKAKEMAGFILSIPVKKMSPDVIRIKDETMQILNNKKPE
jgi:tetratricopeptide (TPR) repeat protein